MILIKSDTRLKKVFERLIKTYGEHVEWNGIFAIAAGNLMLPGRVRTLFFQLEQKKLFSRVIDLQVDYEKAEHAEGNEILANALNIILYAFGKWGIIPGLRVDKDFGQLNQLFMNVLEEIKIDVKFDSESLKFYINEESISYEDVIRRAIDWANIENAFGQEISPEEEAILGLWHTVQWKREQKEIERVAAGVTGLEASRLGHQFYPVDYLCPICGEPMHMVVFPVDQEVLVETEEGRVYLARAYTCKECMRYYTPVPGRLIREGDYYTLMFEEDVQAYEDYMDLLGRVGERCSNYKLNEFEADRLKKKNEDALQQESQGPIENVKELTEQQLRTLMQHAEVGDEIYKKAEITKQELEKEWLRRQQSKAPQGKKQRDKDVVAKLKVAKTVEDQSQPLTIPGKATEHKPLKSKEEGVENKEHGVTHKPTPQTDHIKSDKKNFQSNSDILSDNVSQQSMTVEKPTVEQEKQEIYEKENIENLNRNEDKETQPSQNREGHSTSESEKAIYAKAKSCQGKSYAKVKDMLEEIRRMEAPEEVKNQILFQLTQYQVKQAQNEAKNLMAKLPEMVGKKEYESFKQQLIFYGEEEVADYIKILNEKRNETERKEISQVIKQARKTGRDDLHRLYESLGTQGFQEENLKPFREKIYDKIYEMDEAEIHRICPDMFHLSFDQGIEVMKRINAGVFLPELKQKTVNMLDKRLIKMKMDENIQLVRKLKKEMEANVKDIRRLHFYDANSVNRVREDQEANEEDTYALRAASNIGEDYGRYEYPVFIGDSSRSNSGKEGFIITPEHLFCRTLFQAASYRIEDIVNLSSTGLFQKSIQIHLKDGSHKRLPAVVKSDSRDSLMKVLGDFIQYLHEKPESRKISYLARDKHEVICCYRCGFAYKGSGECPKCGYKHNR